MCAKAALADDAVAFYAGNRRFHASVYAAGHNAYLTKQTVQLADRLEPYRREATFHPGLMALTMTEHERIFRAILAMDQAAAGEHMRGHLDTLRDDAVSVARAAEKAGRP
jgi:DNA-binding GntR family transcriptional regulator